MLNMVLQSEFLLEYGEHCMFDIARQVIEAAAAHRVPIKRNIAQAVIFAWEQHLHEAIDKGAVSFGVR